MADNVTVNGVPVATDDRGGVHHQRVLPSGANAAAHGTLSLTASAAAPALIADGTRRSMMIQNTSAVPVYVGTTAALTTVNGIQVDAGLNFTTEYNGAIYAIVASGTATVRYWTEGDA